MTLQIEAAIAAAMFARLELFAVQESPPIEIAAPNRAFDPPEGIVYLDTNFLPNRTVPIGVSGRGANRYMGLLQINVMWPTDEGGLIPALDLAGRIARHFGKGTKLSGHVSFKLDNEPSIAPPLTEPGRFRVPVTVPYRVFVVPMTTTTVDSTAFDSTTAPGFDSSTSWTWDQAA